MNSNEETLPTPIKCQVKRRVKEKGEKEPQGNAIWIVGVSADDARRQVAGPEAKLGDSRFVQVL